MRWSAPLDRLRRLRDGVIRAAMDRLNCERNILDEPIKVSMHLANKLHEKVDGKALIAS